MGSPFPTQPPGQPQSPLGAIMAALAGRGSGGILATAMHPQQVSGILSRLPWLSSLFGGGDPPPSLQQTQQGRAAPPAYPPPNYPLEPSELNQINNIERGSGYASPSGADLTKRKNI